MPRRQRPNPHEQIEETIRRTGSIGALERLAGVGSAQDERAAFWAPFCKLLGAEGLDAGIAELKLRIRAGAAVNRIDNRPADRAQPQQR